MNILYGYSYLPGTPILTQTKQWYLRERDYYKAREGGYFQPEVELGQHIQAGQRIGTIYYPYSDTTEQISAKEDGFLFSLRYGHQIPAGSNLFSLLSGEAL
jgi:predicted deacylase